MHFVRIALGWNGRIDRITFFAATAALALASLAIEALGWKAAMHARGGQWLGWGVFALPLFWSGFVLNVKRLRDMGRSPLIAFVPTLLLVGAVMLALGGTFAGVRSGDGYMFLSALLLGGGVIVVAALASIAMLLWLALARTHPAARGEDLSFGAVAGAFGTAEPAPAYAIAAPRTSAPRNPAAALGDALARRESAPPFAASGLPRRPPAGGGGFGRR
jgi:uncharacterized membrane protein YhaH (DUF805 family)